jgi:hypothetical protein
MTKSIKPAKPGLLSSSVWLQNTRNKAEKSGKVKNTQERKSKKADGAILYKNSPIKHLV